MRGVRRSTMESSIARPACTTPRLSCSVPGRNPVVSSMNTIGMLYRLQKRMKRAFLYAASTSMKPVENALLFATKPTT